MTWFKLDDRVLEHPRMLGLSDGAFRLWVAGLAYCSRHLTDGRIPAKALTTLSVSLDRPGKVDGYVEELVEAGLWIEAARPAGWEVDGYLAHQQSRAQVEAARERGRAYRARVRAHDATRASAETRGERARTDTDTEDVTPPKPPPGPGETGDNPPELKVVQ